MPVPHLLLFPVNTKGANTNSSPTILDMSIQCIGLCGVRVWLLQGVGLKCCRATTCPRSYGDGKIYPCYKSIRVWCSKVISVAIWLVSYSFLVLSVDFINLSTSKPYASIILSGSAFKVLSYRISKKPL